MSALRKNEFGTIAARLEHRLSAGQEAGAEALRQDITADMGDAKHGHHWPGLDNTSSAPGESPAIQSGALAESLRARPGSGTDWMVSASTPYARRLEYGDAVDTEFGSADGKIAARPYMVPGAHRIARAHWARLVRILIGKDAT